MRTQLQVDLGKRNSHLTFHSSGISFSIYFLVSAYLWNAYASGALFFLFGTIHDFVATPIVQIYHSFLSQASNMGHYHLGIPQGPLMTIIFSQGYHTQHTDRNDFRIPLHLTCSSLPLPQMPCQDGHQARKLRVILNSPFPILSKSRTHLNPALSSLNTFQN